MGTLTSIEALSSTMFISFLSYSA